MELSAILVDKMTYHDRGKVSKTKYIVCSNSSLLFFCLGQVQETLCTVPPRRRRNGEQVLLDCGREGEGSNVGREGGRGGRGGREGEEGGRERREGEEREGGRGGREGGRGEREGGRGEEGGR